MVKQIIHSIRNFKRRPLLLFISVPGLALGITGFLMLTIYLHHEQSYDKHFANRKRVVRLYNKLSENNQTTTYPICLRKAYTEIPQQIPEIESATQIYRGGMAIVSRNNIQFRHQQLLFADKEFFKVFGLDLLEGNTNKALEQVNSVVITQSESKKLFKGKNALGKLIKINDNEYIITGVIKDFPETTHFQFDLLASIRTIHPENFGGLEFFTYYLMKKGFDFEDVSHKIAALNDSTITHGFGSMNIQSQSGIEKLTDLYFKSICDFDLSEKANPVYFRILLVITIFLLLIAGINYLNLFVLYGEKRSMEIAIRKTFGAETSSLSRIFYLETFLLTLLAFVLSIIFTKAGLPLFSQVINDQLNFSEIVTPSGIILSIIFLLFITFITGIYPSFYLPRLNIINILKGDNRTRNRKKTLAILMVLIQFSISIFLIVSILIVHAQLNYLKNIPLGFNVNHVICVSGFSRKIREKSKSIGEELKKLPFVKEAGSSAHSMGGGCSGQLILPYGASQDKAKSINQYRVKPGFCKTLKLPLIQGRYFTASEADTNSIILNEAAVKMLGLKDPLNKFLVMDVDPLKVVGIVKDFYYSEYAGVPIQPLVLSYAWRVNNFYLRIIGNFSSTKRKAVAKVFSQFDPDYQLVSYPLKDTFEAKFSHQNRFLFMLFFGSLLAIFLSFAGMFALSVFTVEKQTKEIGIRKVLGSTSYEVLLHLLNDTLQWVLWSMPVAFLVSWYLARNWLEEFSNKIELNPLFFIAGGVIALLIAILSVSIKGLQAARQNPVKSLRYE